MLIRAWRRAEEIEGASVEYPGVENFTWQVTGAAKLAAFVKNGQVDLKALAEAAEGSPWRRSATAEDYAANLNDNLKRLVEGMARRYYRAPCVRKVYIPKARSPSSRRTFWRGKVHGG